MREIDKGRTINNIQSISKDGNVILINKDNRNKIDEFYFQPEDTKDIKRFIKNVENLVRSSVEYSNYISYLSNDQGIINDALMSKITSDSATLEFHHYPFTLYDIVEIVLNYNIKRKNKVTSISLAEEVMKLHYKNIVGLTRVSKTVHQLAHSGSIFIPLDSIFGDVNEFINQYFDSIFTDQIEKYNILVEIDKNKNFVNDLKIK